MSISKMSPNKERERKNIIHTFKGERKHIIIVTNVIIIYHRCWRICEICDFEKNNEIEPDQEREP